MKRILLVLSAILITNTVFSQMPTTNLLAWYPFCADTIDHSGNVRDLTVTGIGTGAPVLTTDRFLNVKSAYQFNGFNSLMRTSTFFSAAADFSYSCWINATVKQSSLIIFNGHVTGNGFGLVMNNGTIGSAGDTVSILFGGMGLYLSTPVSLNNWHHLVFTRGGNSYQLYVDTALIGSFVDYFYPLTSPDVFNVGYDYASNTDAFNGKIDDIAVYSKQLSLAEIKALYYFNPDILPFTLGNDTAICTNNVVLSPTPPTPGAQYLWSTGSVSTSNVVTPPAFPGANYWLTISKPFGCTSSDTIKVREVVTKVNIGPRDTAFCAGNTKIFNSPLVRVPGETYLWSTGDTTGTLAANTAGTYWLTIDSLGCFGSDTTGVTIKPHLTVTLGPDTASCKGAFVTLQSSTVYTSTLVTYVWQALPILAFPVTTPTIVASVTGTYWLTVTDTNGCPGADTINVLIVSDTFNFWQTDTAICQGQTFSIGTRVTINPNATYQWLPTTGMATSNVANPNITTSVSATYVLTVSYAGCKDSVDSFHLDVQPNPIVGYFGPPRSVCINDTIHITSTVSPAWYTHYTYTWTPGINLDDPTATTVVFTAGDTTDLILTVTTPHGCTGSDSVMINVHPSEFFFLDTTAYLCPGDSIKFKPLMLPIPEPTTATFQWIPSIYVSNPFANSTWVHAITSQNYTIVGTSQFGCLDTGNVSIVVYPAAVFYMEDSAVIYPGGSYQVSPQTNCMYFSWWPDIGLNNSVASNPLLAPSENTVFTVHASTEFGCATTDSIKIRVSPATLIALPNAFTPGAGINNYFKVMKNGLAGLNYFRIYDRWGIMVYDSKDIDAGWDGTYKGKPQPFGVYVYEIEAVTNTAKVFHKQGNVTLIR